MSSSRLKAVIFDVRSNLLILPFLGSVTSVPLDWRSSLPQHPHCNRSVRAEPRHTQQLYQLLHVSSRQPRSNVTRLYRYR